MKRSERIRRLKNRLELYYDAEEKILLGQSVTIGPRAITRAGLASVQKKISELEAELKNLEGSGGRRTMRTIPMDW